MTRRLVISVSTDGNASGAGNDKFLGDRGNDLMIGDNQKLSKHAKLSGGGPDTLRGGRDDDKFDGGPSSDTCQGGTGTDHDVGHPHCENSSSIP